MYNLAQFCRLQNFMTNIFGTDEDIQNQTSTWLTAISLEFGEKSLVNFALETL